MGKIRKPPPGPRKGARWRAWLRDTADARIINARRRNIRRMVRSGESNDEIYREIDRLYGTSEWLIRREIEAAGRPDAYRESDRPIETDDRCRKCRSKKWTDRHGVDPVCLNPECFGSVVVYWSRTRRGLEIKLRKIRQGGMLEDFMAWVVVKMWTTIRPMKLNPELLRKLTNDYFSEQGWVIRCRDCGEFSSEAGLRPKCGHEWSSMDRITPMHPTDPMAIDATVGAKKGPDPQRHRALDEVVTAELEAVMGRGPLQMASWPIIDHPVRDGMESVEFGCYWKELFQYIKVAHSRYWAMYFGGALTKYQARKLLGIKSPIEFKGLEDDVIADVVSWARWEWSGEDLAVAASPGDRAPWLPASSSP